MAATRSGRGFIWSGGKHRRFTAGRGAERADKGKGGGARQELKDEDMHINRETSTEMSDHRWNEPTFVVSNHPRPLSPSSTLVHFRSDGPRSDFNPAIRPPPSITMNVALTTKID